MIVEPISIIRFFSIWIVHNPPTMHSAHNPLTLVTSSIFVAELPDSVPHSFQLPPFIACSLPVLLMHEYRAWNYIRLAYRLPLSWAFNQLKVHDSLFRIRFKLLNPFVDGIFLIGTF